MRPRDLPMSTPFGKRSQGAQV